ncbi:ATP-binding protein [Rhodovulum sulfidophilum]|uniref:coiled-coil domain-containing protein n=1 Tax=Rhodovulum sulfidophilum TaxID=35806 RepID=UPI00192557AF|nr:ATP-binding protein [Rhodovulum sulfidophilum]MBL3587383.1 ATP-binding protein [Rhodovulum sulfidophilum]
MTALFIALARWLAGRFNDFATLLERVVRSDETHSKFVNLAPTDKADDAGVYSEAIHFATSDIKVKNIALTGPYGSGKSSIIQSYLTKHRPRALHISLAAFVPDEDVVSKDITRQEIERSILQQMLYGADANRLPLSRFKRIQSPGVWSIFTSLYILLGSASLWYVFYHRDSVFNASFFSPFSLSNWENLSVFAIASIFLWTTVHHFYVASFGVSLKSVSLKDIEIRPAADDQESILNRHLDEIIYFFQSTDYDLVIIEDLDRFNDPEIFTTLREINGLVNENAGVKRTIRFLYALRDDMFVNTDRTKFFEFIIPVIPIINSSNSIDMVLEQGRRLELDERLDRQFLREVSRYLNDLRLIQNIFNEYAIYVANLETDEENLLDANKLLAILIYKNVYPRDFEKLHRGAGSLAEILSQQDELIAHGEALCRAEISELEQEIQTAESQTPSDLKELRQIYGMALIEKLPEQVVSVILDGRTQIPLSKIVEHDVVERLIEKQQIVCRVRNNSNQLHDISSVQADVNPQKSYEQRKAEIESKAADNKSRILRQIRDLRSKIAGLRTTKLNELLRLNAKRVDNLFEGFGENGELARFLILEGHLDDTYYQYTSLFHSGRLSPNDNKFLIQIRAFVTPEPGFPIDNPNEVIAAMRDEDFRQSYVLNVKLVDSLLSDQSRNSKQAQKLFEYLSSEFESCEAFFDAYYASGSHVAELTSGLADRWKGFVPTAIASSRSITHVTQLVANLPENSLRMLAKDFRELPAFVASNLPEILAQAPEIEPERLKCLDFEVKEFAAIKEHPEVLSAMFEAGLFELTITNLQYVYQTILGKDDLKSLREGNFTAIRSTNNSILLERVERDFETYLSNVLLELPENSKEDAAAIVDVVQHENLDQDDLRRFLERQTSLLPSLDDVPEKLHAMLFKLRVIEPTWVNCLAFMRSNGFEAESLVEYFDRDDVRSALLKHPIPDDADSKQLRLFLFEAGSLSDVAYKEYAHSLPNPFKFCPEDLEQSKLKILIDERKIIFTAEILEALYDNRDLQVAFVATNIDTYLDDPGTFALDDGFREELLRSDIDQAAKREIVKLMDLTALVDLPERSALIGPIIDNADVNSFSLDGNVVKALIKHSRPIATQISLLNKCHSLLANDEVRHVLTDLPTPFSEIRTGYGIPRLKNNPENLALVKWLDSRGIISSWSEGSLFSNDIRVNLYRS